jgi:DNA-binding beta-propeller fold protein YncE
MHLARLILAATFAAFPALGAAAQLLVLNKSDAALAFVDPASGKIAATVPTGEGPHEVEVSTDGRLAFVSNYGGRTSGNTLSVIDIGARKELKRVDLGEMRRPHGLAFSGGKLYFTSEESKSIGRYDPVKQTVDWKYPVGQDGTHMVLASRDGKRFFTSNIGSNTVSILEPVADGQWKQRVVKVGLGPEGLDLTPDERTLWSAHSRDGGLSIIDTDSGKVIRTVDAKTQRSNRVKITPDGRLALISDLGAGNLLVLDAHQYTEVKRLSLGSSPAGILVAPDGATAYVAVTESNRIAVIDLKTLSIAKTFEPGHEPDGMAWVR